MGVRGSSVDQPTSPLRGIGQDSNQQFPSCRKVITRVSWMKHISRIHSRQGRGSLANFFKYQGGRTYAYPFFLSKSSSMDSTGLRAVEGPRRRPGWKKFKQIIVRRIMAPSIALK